MAAGIERHPDTGIGLANMRGLLEGKLSRNNTSGVRGVSWHASTRKWVARISEGGRTRTLGYYDTIDEAAEARAEAVRRRYGEGDDNAHNDQD